MRKMTLRAEHDAWRDRKMCKPRTLDAKLFSDPACLSNCLARVTCERHEGDVYAVVKRA